MFKACSFGMGKVTKDVGSQVLRVAVPIPCGGYTPQGATYQSSSCPFNGAHGPPAASGPAVTRQG